MYHSYKSNKNQKPLKFFIQEPFEKSTAFKRDGFGIKGSTEIIHTESNLQRSELTTYKMPQELGTLPLPTTHGRGISTPLLTQEFTREIKSCKPTGTEFYNRSFTLFKETPDLTKHVQSGVEYRQGISTRALNKTKYSSGNLY